MSEIKVNKISPKQLCTQLTLGDSGDTIIIPAGATITNNGTATGFGATYNGAVNWDTTPKTTTVTAASGVGYFINTTAGAVTVNLPVGVVGATIALADYANTWQTNNVTVTPNGTEKIGGTNANATLNVQGQSVTFTYVDSTQGWKNTQDSTSNVIGVSFISATGGTITTCGNYKIHTFTGPGTFTVSSTASSPTNNVVDYLVVAGGGAGANGGRAGGGGAGGFRESKATGAPWTASPLATSTSLPVSATGYPVTVGAGGSLPGGSGSNSIFSTITSAGGGGGVCGVSNGIPGASGGGSSCNDGAPRTGGTGNTPPVSPPQGSPGGSNPGTPTGGYRGAGAGGGGATESGVNAPSYTAGRGGAGATTSISGSSLSYAGGGGGGSQYNAPPGYPAGTPGGASPCGTGGQGAPNTPGQNATAGTTNRGGGGGGSTANFAAPYPLGGAGGSGVVIIRYKYQ